MRMRTRTRVGLISLLATAAVANPLRRDLNNNNTAADCPGYAASSVTTTATSLAAELQLLGPCNAYDTDYERLRLDVVYETDTRLHVRISDLNSSRYEVPEVVVPRPGAGNGTAATSDLAFTYTASPFSFTVSRKASNETLFSTSAPLIFEDRYIRVRTSLPDEPNIYGLGEHSDSFRLSTVNYTRTLWARDAYGIPNGTNLYSSHPVYLDHRTSGTNGVFLLNSNGMDVKIDADGSGGIGLEYSILGGILDFYFLSGPSPVAVSQQYAEIVGTPMLPPYWGLGSHQCRYGYRDWFDVAEVVYNYSQAKIPLETMWTDIDAYDGRKVFTLDEARFPLERVRQIVSNLHANNQKYILMVDPAVAATDYGAYNRGVEKDIFLKERNGTLFEGVVWPGVTVFPDWFHPNATAYWSEEFAIFFDPDSGVDVDGSWIDMNEPANFCPFPCLDPAAYAEENDMPPDPPAVRDPPYTLPGYNFSSSTPSSLAKRQASPQDPEYYTNPPYAIANADTAGLSGHTAHTDLLHANGLLEYNTHNLYGTMMSTATNLAQRARRPSNRPFIITRSTFPGAGKVTGKWLGDNLSTWDKYRISISGLLQFASIYQIPLVGSDVCGFGGDTTMELCARWTTLGAFSPFYRNHNELGSISQEPYRWPEVAAAARRAIEIRYSLLDYLYTALYTQSVDGTPALQPLWYHFPADEATYGIEGSYMYGPALLVAPVLEEKSTSVEVYIPEGRWYDFYTHNLVSSGTHTVEGVGLDALPVYIKGGSIIVMRNATGILTTTELREVETGLLVAPDESNFAVGEWWEDSGDGEVEGVLKRWVWNGTLTVEETVVGGGERKALVASEGGGGDRMAVAAGVAWVEVLG